MFVIDTRAAFRPLTTEFLQLLQTFGADDWNRPTLAKAWRVRDVLAHLTDTALRRVSSMRDRYRPTFDRIEDERGLVALVNRLNAEWVTACQRLSPPVLVDVYGRAATQLSTVMEELPLDGPAFVPVSWAGEDGNQAWLDIGREFTEQWHHQMQIREAVDAPPPSEPSWLRSVLAVAMHGLPHAYRQLEAPAGTTIVIDITGHAGGKWRLVRGGRRWHIAPGSDDHPTTLIRVTDDVAWRLLFNAWPAADAAPVQVSGDGPLAAPMLRARSVVV
jgi:uncharacterized protein (TIGR03083 family)